MAVKASYSITIASINDVASTTRWYMLQSSTLTAPTAPTASPPGGSWQTTEPTYSEGSTNSLYFVDETIFSDGTWSYSSVSLSSSYEAAKAAYNKAVAAAAAAAATEQHFWADDSGAHISSTGDHDTSGFHQLMTSVKNAFMHGSTELMTISESLIKMLSGAFELSVESGTNSDTGKTEDIAHLKSQYLSLDGKGTAHGFSGLRASSSTGGLESAIALVNAQADGTSHDDSTVLSNVQVNIGTGDTVLNAEMGVYGSGQTLKQFDGTATSFHTAALIAADAIQVGTAGNLVPLSRLATAIQPVVLYNGGAALTYDTAPGAGTTGTVTLSETAANFKEMTIFYRLSGGICQSVVVPFPDGKTPCLQVMMHYTGDPVIAISTKTLLVSGTSVTVTVQGMDQLWTTPAISHYDDADILIYRVTGRR